MHEWLYSNFSFSVCIIDSTRRWKIKGDSKSSKINQLGVSNKSQEVVTKRRPTPQSLTTSRLRKIHFIYLFIYLFLVVIPFLYYWKKLKKSEKKKVKSDNREKSGEKKCKYQKLVLLVLTTSIQVVYRYYQAICDLNFIPKLALHKFV